MNINVQNVGFVGYRGIIGRTLIQRMIEFNDFKKINLHLYSTGYLSEKLFAIKGKIFKLNNPYDIFSLLNMDLIITCQGSEYTNEIYPKLISNRWHGYWIDSSSALRMKKNTCMVLDVLNKNQIYSSIKEGVKTFIGCNCSTALILLGLHGLFKENLINWMSVMTYQSISGGGSSKTKELISQNTFIHNKISNCSDNSTLKLIRKIHNISTSENIPVKNIGSVLSYNLIPWIDKDLNNGNSKEEEKLELEINKILGLNPKTIPISCLCIRTNTIRCHCFGITMQLKCNIEEKQFSHLIETANPWAKYVENNKRNSIDNLTPLAFSETLNIGVGRFKKILLKKMQIYSVFVIGDQLLWGSAEPIRRMFKILCN